MSQNNCTAFTQFAMIIEGFPSCFLGQLQSHVCQGLVWQSFFGRVYTTLSCTSRSGSNIVINSNILCSHRYVSIKMRSESQILSKHVLSVKHLNNFNPESSCSSFTALYQKRLQLRGLHEY